MPFYCIASKSFAIYSGKSLNQPIVWTFLSHSSSCYSSALFRSSPLEMCWPLFAISVHVLQNVILIQSDLILEHRFVFYVFSLSLSLSYFFLALVCMCVDLWVYPFTIETKKLHNHCEREQAQRGLHIFTTLIVITIIASQITDVLIESETESTLFHSVTIEQQQSKWQRKECCSLFCSLSHKIRLNRKYSLPRNPVLRLQTHRV